MNSDEPGAFASFVPEANVFQEYWGNKPKWICLHKTASGGSAQSIAQFFQATPDKRSVHYIVGQDGAIVQCVQEKDGAGGNCCLETGHAAFLPIGINMNLLTLSIEHVDPASDNSTPLTDAQKTASFRLIKDICQRHTIPMRKGDMDGGIIGHHDIAPLSRARCPGVYPWDELFTFLAQEEDVRIDVSNPTVAGFFQLVSGNQWQCKSTAKIVHGAILDFYAKYGNGALCGLTYLGLPVSDEIPLDAQGNVRQHFERGVVFYDPKHVYDTPPGSSAVYLAHLYSGPGQDPLIAKLQTQLIALQSQITLPQEHAAFLQIKDIVSHVS